MRRGLCITVLVKSRRSINISIHSPLETVMEKKSSRRYPPNRRLFHDESRRRTLPRGWIFAVSLIRVSIIRVSSCETMAAPHPNNKLEKSITYYVVSREKEERERKRKGGRTRVALSRHRRRRDGARCVSYCQIRIYVKARTRCVCPCIYASHYYAPVMPSIRRDPFISEPCILENSNPRLIMNYSYSWDYIYIYLYIYTYIFWSLKKKTDRERERRLYKSF